MLKMRCFFFASAVFIGICDLWYTYLESFVFKLVLVDGICDAGYK